MKIEEGKILEYFVVGHRMKNGKYALIFPDFVELGAVVEREEEVEEKAKKMLEAKLTQLSILPKPKKKLEIMEELESGDFCVAIPLKIQERNNTTIEKNITEEFSKKKGEQESKIEDKIPDPEVEEIISNPRESEILEDIPITEKKNDLEKEYKTQELRRKLEKEKIISIKKESDRNIEAQEILLENSEKEKKEEEDQAIILSDNICKNSSEQENNHNIEEKKRNLPKRKQAIALRKKLEEEGVIAKKESWDFYQDTEKETDFHTVKEEVGKEKSDIVQNGKKLSEDAIKASENIAKTIANFTPNNITKDRLNLVGIVSSVLYLLGAFLPIISVEAFFAKARIYFFSGLFSKSGILNEIPNVRWTIFSIRTLGFLVLFTGIFALISHLKKHSFYSVSAAGISTVLFFISFITLFIKISSFGMFSSMIGLSWAWLFLLLGVCGQIFSVFQEMKNLLEKKEEE